MKFKSFVAAALCCVSLSLAQTSFTPWASYKTITLNTSATGANVATNQLGFPLLVRIDSTTVDVFTGSKGRGADVRFTKANGTTKIPHQIERWDSAGKSAAIWVFVDTLVGNSTTQTLRMYWGKGGEADSSKGALVFPTSKGYVGVWHMAETDSLSAAINSTSNALNMAIYDAEFTGNPAIGVKKGLIGGARSLAGASASDLYMNDAFYSTSALLNPATAVTVSAWFKLARSQSLNRLFQRTRTDGNFRVQFTSGTSVTTMAWAQSNETLTDTVPTPVVDAWHHVQVMADNTSRSVYFDGVLSATATRSGDLSLGGDEDGDGFFIGAKPNSATAGNYFQGDMDEFRVSNVSRTADWVKLEYENQKAAQTLVTLGSTTAQNAAPVIAYTTPVTYGAGFPVNNSPVYTGGPVATFAITPPLSTGLTFNTSTGIIAGTPTVAQGSTVYTVTATGPGGTVTPTVTIIVTAAAAPAITYGAAVICTTGKAFPAKTPVSTGGPITKYGINPALSTGLKLDTNTGVISGTPTVALGATNYTVTATGLGGTGTAVINITVNAASVGIKGSGELAAAFSVRAVGNGFAFRLPEMSSGVRVSIVDLWGRSVWSRDAKGASELIWDGASANGRQAAHGVYIVRLGVLDAKGGVSGSTEKTITYQP